MGRKRRRLAKASSSSLPSKSPGVSLSLAEVKARLALPGEASSSLSAAPSRSFESDEDDVEMRLEASLKLTTGVHDVLESCNAWGIDGRVAMNVVERLKIQQLFPLQFRAISQILDAVDCDVAISAPTGSGKTLMFALPVVHSICNRIVKRLRALVMLPTRELAQQSLIVFEALIEGTDLQVACSNDEKPVNSCDILISTPGRLMDYIKDTKGFTLQHLRILAIDEADRLLGQRYQGWLTSVYEAAFQDQPGFVGVRNGKFQICETTRRHLYGTSVVAQDVASEPLRRILCSATLTKDPRKIAQLKLKRPIYITLQGERIKSKSGNDLQTFVLPPTLKDHVMICKANQKPLVLAQLLTKFGDSPTLVFTASVDATHRLCVFLRQFLGDYVSELSSSQTQAQRRKVLERFVNAKTTVLVVSDVMARGVDLENLTNVVNYDVPVEAKTFVHRAGRVARAGRHGSSYTLLKPDQKAHYRRIRSKIYHGEPEFLETEKEFIEANQGKALECLQTMKKILKKE